MARTARRDVIGLLIEKQVTYTEADADAIRAILNQEGELSAAVELRGRFPGITDNAKAWKPLPPPPCSVVQLRPRAVRALLDTQLPQRQRTSIATRRFCGSLPYPVTAIS